MPKGDVTFRMSAESAAFVQACEAARQKLQATADAARSAGGAIDTMGDKAMKSLGGIVSSAGGVVMSMSGIGSVVGMVVGSFTAGMDRMREKSDKLRESLTGVEDVLYKLNRMQDLPEIRARLSKIAEGVTTREGVEGIYKSAANHLGTRATEGQIESAVGASMGVIKGGGSPETAAGFANIFGDFRTMRGKMEGVSDADVSELSALVQGVRGEGLSEKELKFIAKSDNPKQAIDLILAAAKSHENPRAIESLAGIASKEITNDDIHSARGGERARLTRLSAIPVDNRLSAMIADPTLAAASEQADIKLINSNLGADAENAIATKPFLGRIATFNNLIQNDPNVKAKFQLDSAGIGKSKAMEKGETQAITEEAIWANYTRMMVEGKISKGGVGQLLPAGVVSAIDRGFSVFSNWSIDQHKPGLLLDSDYRRAKKDLQDRSGQELADRLRENTEATQHNTQSNNGGPGLRNNSEGQK